MGHHSLNVTNKTHDSPKGPNSREPIRMPAINTVWATATMFALSQTRLNCKNHIELWNKNCSQKPPTLWHYDLHRWLWWPGTGSGSTQSHGRRWCGWGRSGEWSSGSSPPERTSDTGWGIRPAAGERSGSAVPLLSGWDWRPGSSLCYSGAPGQNPQRGCWRR